MENKSNEKHLHLQVKQETLTEEGTFTGYASIFGNKDSYNDIVQKGAFTNSLRDRKVKLLWQHCPNKPIGKFTKIYEDDKGLFVEGQLFLDIQLAQEAYSLLKNDGIDGISIGYRNIKTEYDEENDIRYLKEVELYEASIVTFPANETATVMDVKKEEKPQINIDNVKTLKEITDFLKIKGLTKSERNAIIVKIKNFVINEHKENLAGERLVKSIKELVTTFEAA